MTTISDLPRDLVEEVLSRVPVTSMRTVRFTCTKWNTISKHESFTKKQIGEAAKKKQMKESFVIMTMNSIAYLMSVNLHGIHKGDSVESSIQPIGKFISLNNTAFHCDDLVIKDTVLHCDGLLLCFTLELNSRLVVWNPYCGQTSWIEPSKSYHEMDMYALGYEMKNKSHRIHKILRYLDAYDESVKHRIHDFEIYNFDTNSWKVIEVTPSWNIGCRGVSLKGILTGMLVKER
ncbi:unnamed protein product [Microthlaspi erraticum]|uniref:F-box domain-containing protein n=1 Tax=Microthlaspi erraticum TaxID=1685480 RepID=A0A6D2HLW9_9BRAS|nr:unnamed protein product [Microthlaspi erraticum]